MKNIKGKELYELLQNGKVVLSDDKTTLISKTTNEVLGRQVASKDGVGYFKAVGDENNTDRGGEVCIEWEWDNVMKVKICVGWE